jgi:hypothetical protein
LPEGAERQGNGWSDFNGARDVFLAIKPFESVRTEVHALGLDPFKNPSVSLLSYSDLVQRLGTGNVLHADQLDPGVRRCMESGKRCTGYQLNQREVIRKRIGNVLADLFNFRRETESEGWSFNGLIVFVDDQVVLALAKLCFRNYETNMSNPAFTEQKAVSEAVRSVIDSLRALDRGEDAPLACITAKDVSIFCKLVGFQATWARKTLVSICIQSGFGPAVIREQEAAKLLAILNSEFKRGTFKAKEKEAAYQPHVINDFLPVRGGRFAGRACLGHLWEFHYALAVVENAAAKKVKEIAAELTTAHLYLGKRLAEYAGKGVQLPD